MDRHKSGTKKNPIITNKGLDGALMGVLEMPNIALVVFPQGEKNTHTHTHLTNLHTSSSASFRMRDKTFRLYL